MNSNETFYIGNDIIETYNYRSVQRDSVRCLLLWLPIGLKTYLLDIIKTPHEKVNPKDVGQHVLKVMKLIKFAMVMLFASDLQIK